MPAIAQNPLIRFERYVEKTETCWLWIGATLNNGYGTFTLKKEFSHVAHRVAYFLYKGELDKEKQLDHLCRNKLCVNPEHLEPVTLKENLHRGNSTKLTDDQVKHIRKSNLKQKVIANMFNVHQSQISRIRNNKRWRIA